MFIQWLLAPENQIESYQVLGNLPTRTSVLETLNKECKLAGGKVLLEQAATVEPLFAQAHPAGIRSLAPPRPPPSISGEGPDDGPAGDGLDRSRGRRRHEAITRRRGPAPRRGTLALLSSRIRPPILHRAPRFRSSCPEIEADL